MTNAVPSLPRPRRCWPARSWLTTATLHAAPIVELGRILADPDMIEDQCAKLAAFYRIETRPLRETIPLADFLVHRGRLLAAALRGNPPPEMIAEAQVLVDRSARTGAVRLGAGLDAALHRPSA